MQFSKPETPRTLNSTFEGQERARMCRCTAGLEEGKERPLWGSRSNCEDRSGGLERQSCKGKSVPSSGTFADPQYSETFNLTFLQIILCCPFPHCSPVLVTYLFPQKCGLRLGLRYTPMRVCWGSMISPFKSTGAEVWLICWNTSVSGTHKGLNSLSNCSTEPRHCCLQPVL